MPERILGNTAKDGTGATYHILVDADGYLLAKLASGGSTQYTEDGASAGGESLTLAGAVRRDTAASSGATDGDYSTLNTDANGRLWVRVGSIDAGTALLGRVSSSDETSTLYNGTTALTPKFAAIAAATSGNNTLLAAVADKKIRVLSMCLVAGAAGNIYFESGAGGTVIFGGSTNKIQLAANGGFVLPYHPLGWFETAVNTLLNMNASSTGPFSGGFTYAEV